MKSFILTLTVFVLGACATRPKVVPVAQNEFAVQVRKISKSKNRPSLILDVAAVNHTTNAIDASKAYWKMTIGNIPGELHENEFERSIIPPGQRQNGVLVFRFDNLDELGDTFELTLEGLKDNEGKDLPAEKVSGEI